MPMNKAFRAQWVEAGYTSVMGSAEVVPPPLKEFIRLYHFTSAEFAISNIGLSRLKLARFYDLNDPFELLGLNFLKHRVQNVVNDFKNEYDSHTGLMCFSANWTSPVLWSHYGAKHRGICLGFDVPRDHAEQVKYEDQRILAKLEEGQSLSNLSPELQRQLRCTKFNHWSYEEEYRVFVQLAETIKAGALYFAPFNQHLRLMEVILGPLCDLPINSVRSLVTAQHPGVTTFGARLAHGSFAIVPKESSVL